MKGGELGCSEAGAAVTAYGRMLVQRWLHGSERRLANCIRRH